MLYVAQAIDRNTGYFGTCTWCETKKDARHYARYYRLIGYKAKIFSDEEYDKANNENAELRHKQTILQKIYAN